jgi:hypothetical protein
MSCALFLSLAIAAECQPASKDNGIADFQWFFGHWSCDGPSAGSGKPISADRSFGANIAEQMDGVSA